MSKPKRWAGIPAVWVLAILAAAFFAYWPALGAGFVWNDDDYVTAPELRGWDGLWRIWFKVGATQQYYPLLHTAFWVEHRLWGDAPAGYHAINILLHAVAACLFVLVLRRVWAGSLGDYRNSSAFLGGLIFALHPVCAESVAWVTEQKNTLSTVFYLLAALCYLRFDRERSRRWYLSGLALFTAAVLSKSVAATLPGALLVVLWWLRGRLSWRRDIVPVLPFIVVGAAAGLFTGWVEKKFIGADGAAFSLTLFERGLLSGRIVWFYLGKLLWPAGLVFIYPHWKVDAGVWWQYLFPLGVLGALAGLWAIRGRTRGPLAAFLLFIGGLFPLLGFFNVYAFVFSYVADHWQYLASLGVIAAAAWAWGRWIRSWLAAAVVLGVLGWLTWGESGNYHDRGTFYRTIVARNPDCWMAHNNLGNLFFAAGRTAEAKREYETSLRLRSDYPDAHSNLSVILLAEGKVEEAIAHDREALRLSPGYADAHNNYGIALAHQGRIAEALAEFRTALAISPRDVEAKVNLANNLYVTGHRDEAVAAYREALLINPSYPEGRNNLGAVLTELGRVPEAIAELEAVVKAKPDYPEAQNNLGNALRAAGRWTEAIERYREAVRLRPAFPNALTNLAYALDRVGRPGEAAESYQAALAVDPANADAEFNLGNAFVHAGRSDQALAHYQASVRLKPQSAAFRCNLGIMLLMAGRKAEAVTQFQEAVRLQPDFAEAHSNLGAALSEMGRFDEAVAQYREALRLMPNYPDAHNNLGAALGRLGRLKEAIPEYEEALRIRPDFIKAHENLAGTLDALGRRAEAEAHRRAAAGLRARPPAAGAGP